MAFTINETLRRRRGHLAPTVCGVPPRLLECLFNSKFYYSFLLFIAINVVAQTFSLRHTWAQTKSLCYKPDCDMIGENVKSDEETE